MTTPPTISERFVIDLVDKIRESSALTANELKDLTIALTSLVETYNADIKTTTRNHNEIILLLKENRDKLKSLLTSVRTMIITVLVAFSILTGAYMLVRSSVKDMVNTETSKQEQIIQQHIENSNLNDH